MPDFCSSQIQTYCEKNPESQTKGYIYFVFLVEDIKGRKKLKLFQA